MKLPSLVAILFMAAATQAFVGPIHPSSIETKSSTSTELAAMSRRSALSITSGFLLGVHMAPKPSVARGTANPAFEDEVNFEPSQQARGEKIDINNAFVVDYKQLPGMYPSAAGKIASHGPYQSVKDIYNIPGVTANDKAMFKKYQGDLTVLPPGRMFKERINQRQST